MAKENLSRYQQKVIKRYYDNQDSISLQRAQELVTELYLVEGKKRDKVWESLCKCLEKLGVPADQIANYHKNDKPELVAQVLQSKF